MLGCGNGNISHVRAVNAAQGLSNYTIQVAQTGIVAGLPYGTEGVQQPGQYDTLDTSGNYREIGVGTNENLSAYQTPGTNLVATTQTFLNNGYYTIVTLSPAPHIQFQILTDDDSAPQSGDYKLRVMDTSTAAGPVDIYIAAAGAPVGGSPVVGNIQFQQVVTNLQLTPGTLEIQVTPHGNTTTVLASKTFSPAAGNVYSIFFLDPPTAGGANYGVLIVNDPIAHSTGM